MSENTRTEKGLLGALLALDGYLDKIVVVGGWCPYFYARYLWRRRVPNIPSTMDVDLGVQETGAEKYEITVFDKLTKSGLSMERIYEKEAAPVEFIYRARELALKLEFITSFETSDDTLNRFLGRALACNRIEAFELLLDRPVTLKIAHGGKKLSVQIPRPEAFAFHKGISFVMRPEADKSAKDLFYLYFMLKFCPDTDELIKRIGEYRGHELFESFQKNMRDYLGDVSKQGYLMLRPFLRAWVEERSINTEIAAVMGAVLGMG